MEFQISDWGMGQCGSQRMRRCTFVRGLSPWIDIFRFFQQVPIDFCNYLLFTVSCKCILDWVCALVLLPNYADAVFMICLREKALRNIVIFETGDERMEEKSAQNHHRDFADSAYHESWLYCMVNGKCVVCGYESPEQPSMSDKPSDAGENVPTAGDSNAIILWASLVVVSLIAALAVVFNSKRKTF